MKCPLTKKECYKEYCVLWDVVAEDDEGKPIYGCLLKPFINSIIELGIAVSAYNEAVEQTTEVLEGEIGKGEIKDFKDITGGENDG